MKTNNDQTIAALQEDIRRHVVAKEPGTVVRAPCPHQRGAEPCPVIGKGKPIRKTVKLSSGQVISNRIWVQQLLCKVHGKFRAIPDFLLPRKQYVAVVVEATLDASIAGESLKGLCDRLDLWSPTTPSRWIRAVTGRLGCLTLRVRRLLHGLTGEISISTTWLLAEAWDALGRLRKAYIERAFAARPRIHFALQL